MAEGESSTTAGAGFLSMVPNQIAALVPTFDPSKDDLQVYTQKVSLLLEAWPAGKYTELVTRLILNCSGSAFLKLQLHQKELMVNDRQSVQKLVEILGGHWGQIGLEKRYEYAERALFKCTQKADESADSYLARADIMWTELNSREMKLSDLQAYITLRGSNLSSDDKKKVLVDADAGSGDLSIDRVGSAIRMLGAGFFQDITGMKRTKLKTYDQATLMAESVDEDENTNDVYAAEDDVLNEDEMIEALVSEGDHDATFITDFENAASEVIQNDEELAAAFNTYTEARKRLSEKFRYRGFWPVSQGGKTKGHAKGKVKLRESFRRVTAPRESLWSNVSCHPGAAFATKLVTGRPNALTVEIDHLSRVHPHLLRLSAQMPVCPWSFCKFRWTIPELSMSLSFSLVL